MQRRDRLLWWESMKVRLDKALVERGLAQSRERAQALILAGRVMVAEQKVQKPGTPVAEDAALRVLGEDMKYVSRGGLKLERALEYWKIPLEGRACVDVGASTGGFTDCMLQHGAVSVLAVDTGYGQIAHKLRVDERVRLMERCNARLLAAGELMRGGRDFVSGDGCFVYLGNAGAPGSAEGAGARGRDMARRGGDSGEAAVRGGARTCG